MSKIRTLFPSVFREVSKRAAHRWAECVLAAIILASVLLSICWVFKVPILQNPDENSHIDYAFSIYSAGRLLNVRRPPSEWNVQARLIEGIEGAAYDFNSHLYTLYLIDSTDFMRIRYHPKERVSRDYGTTWYYSNLDHNAPHHPAQVPASRPQDNPWLVTGYPFAYYTVLAIWMKALSLFSNGPAFLFFGARLFSVILLVFSLVLSYFILRELHLRKGRVLALTAIVGFFPMTSFISSAIQPDNLTWLLMSVCFYLSLLLSRKPRGYLFLTLLGAALGLLLVTKYHFYLFTAVPILGLVVADHIFRQRSMKDLLKVLSVLTLPSLLFFAVQLWIVWGERITGGNVRFATSGQLGGLKRAFLDFYRGGPALISYWGTFGWGDTALIIVSPTVQGRVVSLLSAVTLLVLLLVLFRFEQVITRLVVLAWRGRWRMALRIAFSKPLMNSNFIFSAFMLTLYALHDGGFNAQGRHWFPYFLSGFLLVTEFAPRALSHRKTQIAVSTLLLVGLLLYSVVGSYYSIKSINNRYYATELPVR